jgi:hypothetical protein
MRKPRPEARATRRLQEAFLGDLTGRRRRSSADREAVFRQPRRGTVEDRWHVYAHGYVARIVEALGLEYAAVRRILGAEAFAALVERYLGVFPPRSFDLARVGDRLPQLLEFDRLSVELPFLPDLARLERRVADAFTAPDAAPLCWAELQARPPEEVADMPLGAAPGAALVRSDWPLRELWLARLQENDDEISIDLEDRPSRILVSRRDGRVRVEDVTGIEAALVEAASAGGLTLGDLRELSGVPAEPDGLRPFLDAFRALVERAVFVHKRSTGWAGALEIPKEDRS